MVSLYQLAAIAQCIVVPCSICLQGGAQARPDRVTANRVTVSASATMPDADGKQTVTVTLDIDKGWRILANPVGKERFESWRTVVSLKPAIKPASLRIEYPPGKLFRDPQAPEADFRYYDGKTEIKAFLQRSPGDKGPIEVEVVFVAASDGVQGETTLFFPKQLKLKVP